MTHTLVGYLSPEAGLDLVLARLRRAGLAPQADPLPGGAHVVGALVDRDRHDAAREAMPDLDAARASWMLEAADGPAPPERVLRARTAHLRSDPQAALELAQAKAAQNAERAASRAAWGGGGPSLFEDHEAARDVMDHQDRAAAHTGALRALGAPQWTLDALQAREAAARPAPDDEALARQDLVRTIRELRTLDGRGHLPGGGIGGITDLAGACGRLVEHDLRAGRAAEVVLEGGPADGGLLLLPECAVRYWHPDRRPPADPLAAPEPGLHACYTPDAATPGVWVHEDSDTPAGLGRAETPLHHRLEVTT